MREPITAWFAAIPCLCQKRSLIKEQAGRAFGILPRQTRSKPKKTMSLACGVQKYCAPIAAPTWAMSLMTAQKTKPANAIASTRWRWSFEKKNKIFAYHGSIHSWSFSCVHSRDPTYGYSFHDCTKPAFTG